MIRVCVIHGNPTLLGLQKGKWTIKYDDCSKRPLQHWGGGDTDWKCNGKTLNSGFAGHEELPLLVSLEYTTRCFCRGTPKALDPA